MNNNNHFVRQICNISRSNPSVRRLYLQNTVIFRISTLCMPCDTRIYPNAFQWSNLCLKIVLVPTVYGIPDLFPTSSLVAVVTAFAVVVVELVLRVVVFTPAVVGSGNGATTVHDVRDRRNKTKMPQNNFPIHNQSHLSINLSTQPRFWM